MRAPARGYLRRHEGESSKGPRTASVEPHADVEKGYEMLRDPNVIRVVITDFDN